MSQTRGSTLSKSGQYGHETRKISQLAQMISHLDPLFKDAHALHQFFRPENEGRHKEGDQVDTVDETKHVGGAPLQGQEEKKKKKRKKKENLSNLEFGL